MPLSFIRCKIQGYFPNWRLWTCSKNMLTLVYEVLRQEFVTERWPSKETAAAAAHRTIFDCFHQRRLLLQLHSLVIAPPLCATPVFNFQSLVYINPAFVCLQLYKRKISCSCAWKFYFQIFCNIFPEPFWAKQFLNVAPVAFLKNSCNWKEMVQEKKLNPAKYLQINLPTLKYSGNFCRFGFRPD